MILSHDCPTGKPGPGTVRRLTGDLRPHVAIAAATPLEGEYRGYPALVSPDGPTLPIGIAVSEFSPARLNASVGIGADDRMAAWVSRAVRSLQEMGFAVILAPIPEPVKVDL